MEKIKSVKGKSPISLLKFQEKSDFKKFLKFIQDQTKELKGVKKPKENKIKSALKVGAIGLGGLGIAGLFGAAAVKDKDDEFEKGKGLDGEVDLFAAIGRRNVPGVSDPKRPLASIKLPGDPRLKQNIRLGTRTRITRERTPEEAKSAEDARRNRLRQKKVVSESEQIAEKERAKRGIKKRLTQNISRQETRSQIVPKEIQKLKGGQGVLSGAGVKDLPERPTSKYSDYGSRKRFSKPKTSFPKTNVKFYGDMGFQKFFGGTRIGKVRPKPGFKIDPLSGDIIPIEPIEQIIREAEADPNVRKQFLKDSGLDDLNKRVTQSGDLPSERFSKMRRGTRTFADFSPFRDAKSKGQSRVTGTIGRRTFPQKGLLGRLSRILVNKSKNPKITRDSFLGISYKGPKLSMLAKVVNNPAVKVVLFGIDLLNTIRSGGQVFNSRDNLGTALYDLYVSINNAIYKDDPEKLKLYKSLSSNEKIMIKQYQRNMKIMERQDEAVQQKFLKAIGKDSNNIIVVPQNQQNTNMSSGNNNIPTRTGGTEISLLPFEPLNIGDDILLHKLNQ